MKRSDKEIEILYHDNHLLICEKPAPLLTQPDQTGRESLISLLIKQLQKELDKEKIFLHPIHRLDKLVSGIVLCARSSKALQRLQKQQREKKITKIYIAEVEGKIIEEEGTLTNWLEHKKHKAEISDKGKRASLHWKVVERKEKSTLVEITLHTGRYHQIRAQCAAFSHPVVGDGKYGSRYNYDRILLHHAKISFMHPTSGKTMTFTSKPDFYSSVDL